MLLKQELMNQNFPMYEIILNNDNFYKLYDNGKSLDILLLDKQNYKLYYFSIRKQFIENN